MSTRLSSSRSSAGPILFSALLAFVALGLIVAAIWAAGPFAGTTGRPVLPAVSVIGVLVGIGFAVLAMVVYRLHPGMAADAPTLRASSDQHDDFSPWKAAVTALVVALGGTLAFLGIAGWAITWFDASIRLPMLIVVALVGLLAAIAFVVIAIGIFNLKDPTQALGLPAGSVQAIIALSLILLFVTMTVFLVVHVGRAAPNSPSIDIAKQVLAVLGTLVTAVSSFYFGSRSSTEAVRSSQLPPRDGMAGNRRRSPAPGGDQSGTSTAGSASASGAAPGAGGTPGETSGDATRPAGVPDDHGTASEAPGALASGEGLPSESATEAATPAESAGAPAAESTVPMEPDAGELAEADAERAPRGDHSVG